MFPTQTGGQPRGHPGVIPVPPLHHGPQVGGAQSSSRAPGQMPTQQTLRPASQPAGRFQQQTPVSLSPQPPYPSRDSFIPHPHPDIIPDEVRGQGRLIEVSDLRYERITEEQYRELLSTYIIYTFEKIEPLQEYDEAGERIKSSWVKCTRRPMPNVDNAKARQEIQRLNRKDTESKRGKGISLLEKRQSLGQNAQDQISSLGYELSAAERDPTRFGTILEQIDWTLRPVKNMHEKVSKKCSSTKRKANTKEKYERATITAYFKRCPRSDQLPSELYRKIESEKRQRECQREGQQRDQASMHMAKQQMHPNQHGSQVPPMQQAQQGHQAQPQRAQPQQQPGMMPQQQQRPVMQPNINNGQPQGQQQQQQRMPNVGMMQPNINKGQQQGQQQQQQRMPNGGMMPPSQQPPLQPGQQQQQQLPQTRPANNVQMFPANNIQMFPQGSAPGGVGMPMPKNGQVPLGMPQAPKQHNGQMFPTMAGANGNGNRVGAGAGVHVKRPITPIRVVHEPAGHRKHRQRRGSKSHTRHSSSYSGSSASSGSSAASSDADFDSWASDSDSSTLITEPSSSGSLRFETSKAHSHHRQRSNTEATLNHSSPSKNKSRIPCYVTQAANFGERRATRHHSGIDEGRFTNPSAAYLVTGDGTRVKLPAVAPQPPQEAEAIPVDNLAHIREAYRAGWADRRQTAAAEEVKDDLRSDTRQYQRTASPVVPAPLPRKYSSVGGRARPEIHQHQERDWDCDPLPSFRRVPRSDVDRVRELEEELAGLRIGRPGAGRFREDALDEERYLNDYRRLAALSLDAQERIMRERDEVDAGEPRRREPRSTFGRSFGFVPR